MTVRDAAPGTAPGAGLEEGLRLLAAGIPLTLLLDLAAGPHSRDLYADEPAELDWTPVSTPVQSRRLAG
jgi:hypothetical protein